MVGNPIDYEPTFDGSSTVFVHEDTLTLGLVPSDGSEGYIKVAEVTHIPRLDEATITVDDLIRSFNGTFTKDDISKFGKGAATVKLIDKQNIGHYFTFVIFDSKSRK